MSAAFVYGTYNTATNNLRAERHCGKLFRWYAEHTSNTAIPKALPHNTIPEPTVEKPDRGQNDDTWCSIFT